MAVFSKMPPAPDANPQTSIKNLTSYLVYMQETVEYSMAQKDKKIADLEARVKELEP